MLAKNEGRPLRDVAQEVIQKERTPMAEKTKQLFAMLWWVLVLVLTYTVTSSANVHQATHGMQTSQNFSASQSSLFTVCQPMRH